MKKVIISIAMSVFAIFLSFTQEITSVTTQNTSNTDQLSPSTNNVNSDDDLFSDVDDVMIDEVEQSKATTDKNSVDILLGDANILLKTEKIRFGGSLTTSLNLYYGWINPYEKPSNLKEYFLNPSIQKLKTTIDTTLFFNAHPTDTTKIYGKFGFGYPFTKDLVGSITIPNTSSVPPLAGKNFPLSIGGSVNIRIIELYTDFSIKDIAFFRFGKHAVKWGVGYFYSPADVINLSTIDPQDPNAEREGPVSLRTHIIFPGTQHNLWAYLLPDTKNADPKKTAGAIKGEFVAGDWELGVGAWYQYGRAPRLMFTASGSIMNKVSVFGEAIAAWGSDEIYYHADTNFTNYEQKNKAFVQATAGLSYTFTQSHTSIASQYFYNGFGYADPKPLIQNLQQDPITNAIVLKKLPTYIGQHYVAINLSQNKIGTDKLHASVFSQYGFSELAGLTAITLSWNIVSELKLKTGLTFSYGNTFSKNITYNFGFAFGGGKF